MEEYADLNLIGYLYNTCYGGFTFSDAFLERYNERLKEEGRKPIGRYESEKGRADPIAISIFQEMGPKESSGDFSRLKLYWVPDDFLSYTSCDEYDGKETVGVSKEEMYAGLLHSFMSERATNPSLTLDDLEARYKTATVKWERFREFLRNVCDKKGDS